MLYYTMDITFTLRSSKRFPLAFLRIISCIWKDNALIQPNIPCLCSHANTVFSIGTLHPMQHFVILRNWFCVDYSQCCEVYRTTPMAVGG